MPGAGALLACILLLLISGKKRRVKLAFGLLAFALLAAAFVACGGGSSVTPPINTGTPTGTWTVTVTGTSGTLSHTLNVPVTVD
jgi:peptidoglycan/LPS O-acetylase OafA/YrhL